MSNAQLFAKGIHEIVDAKLDIVLIWNFLVSEVLKWIYVIPDVKREYTKSQRQLRQGTLYPMAKFLQY